MGNDVARRQPPGGRPRTPGVDEAVLKATVRRLIEDGYAGMSVAKVAADAGTTRPSVYLRWPTKQSLVVAAVRSVLHEPLDVMAEDWDTLPAKAKLLRLIGMAKPREGSQSHLLYVTIIAESRRIPELLDLYKEHVVEPRVQLIITVLRAMRDDGDIRADVDIDHVAAMLYGPYLALRLRPDGAPAVIDQRIADLIWPALAPGGAARADG